MDYFTRNRATSESVVSFCWKSSYYWHVDPYDNGDLFVKVSLNGGITWQPYIWTFGEIGVWTNWVWYQTTIYLSGYAGNSIMVAFNIVADDNADIALDNIYLGDASGSMPKGTISMSSPCKADANRK